jgi:ABC-2 type transport system permease protein
MRAAHRIFAAFLRASLQVLFAYRAAMLLWAVWGIVTPLVTLAVWSTAAAPKPIAGFTQGQFATYFILAMVINHFTVAWDMEVFGWQIRQGTLSADLLRPVLPVWRAVSDNVAFKLLTGTVVMPAWIVLGLTVRADWSGVTPTSVALAVPAVLMASALNFLWGYCVAMIAFWTQKNNAINQLYWSLAWFLGGRIAPLAVLPPAFRAVAAWLPFQTMYAFPIEVVMGREAPGTILHNFALQVTWILVGLAAWRLAWRAGLRQYSAVGA